MADDTAPQAPAEAGAALDAAHSGFYILRLYIAGSTPRSLRAVDHVRRVCNEYLVAHYKLEVIDIYQQPTLAEGERIIAAPTLIKKLPPPLRRIIGDLSKTERLLVGLDLRKKSEPDAASRTGE